ncbi:hypothetical protein BJ742DRAFT_713349 [Cladochytrium replicatum]|nr:hypothetical protein BJ742DRAFT_713349 [Cladochytrium replicatum]
MRNQQHVTNCATITQFHFIFPKIKSRQKTNQNPFTYRNRKSLWCSLHSQRSLTMLADSLPVPTGGASMIVSWSVAGKNVLVVGGSTAAALRTFFSLEADAYVTVVAPAEHLCSELKTRADKGQISWYDREFQPVDVEGKALVFVTAEDHSLVRKVIVTARQRKVPVNISVSPELSDFWMMSTHRDAALQISVSTSGNGPRLASKVRHRIAAALPPNAGFAVQRISALRQALRNADPAPESSGRRMAFINTITDSWSLDRLAELNETDIKKLIEVYHSGKVDDVFAALDARAGVLRFVSAGPGEIDALTVGAHRAITEADLVIASADVSKDITSIVSGELRALQKDVKGDHLVQAVLSAALPALKRGLAVVRLFSESAISADPEVKAFAQNKHRPIIVPGLSINSVKKETQTVAPSSAPVSLAAPAVEVQPLEKKKEIILEVVHDTVPTPTTTKGRLERLAYTYQSQPRLLDGSAVVSSIAYYLSRFSYILKAHPKEYAGQRMEMLASKHIKNAFNSETQVLILDSRTGAGSVVHGTLSAGALASSVGTSESVAAMIPALHQVAAARLPGVFHIASHALSENLVVSPSNADVLSAAHTGTALLSSATVQEAHDLSILAHVSAVLSSLPVLHFFDGSRLSREVGNVRVASKESISSIGSLISSIAPGDKKSFLEAFEEVGHILSSAFGKRYAPFEYVGRRDAEHVVVAMGASTGLAEIAVKKLTAEGQRVGLLKIRLYRPWSVQHFLGAVPPTVKRISVLEDNATRGSHGPLFLDVTGAFYSGVWPWQIPFITKSRFAPGIGSFHPVGIEALLQNLQSSYPSFDFIIKVDDRYLFANDDAVFSKSKAQYILWDAAHEDTTAVADTIVAQANVDIGEDAQVQKFVAQDGVRVLPIAATHLRVSNVRITAPHLIRFADYVGVHHVGVLADVNVAVAMKKGAILLVNAPWKTTAEVEKEIPPSTRAELARKHIKLYVIDAHAVARDYTVFMGKPSEYVNLILEGVFFKLTDNHNGVLALEQKVANSGVNFNVIRTKISALRRALSIVQAIKIPHHWMYESSIHELASTAANTLPLDKVAEPTDSEDVVTKVMKNYNGAIPYVFKEAFGLIKELRPDVEDSYQVTLTENVRLTPDAYDRNVFHMEMDTTGTGLRYEIGEALGVHGHNDPVEVARFLKAYGIDGDEVVYYERPGVGTEIRTVSQVFTQIVDLFGQPGKKFYQFLAAQATDLKEREYLNTVVSADGTDELRRLQEEEFVNHGDLLLRTKSARPSVHELIQQIPAIKPRHYSIASSMNMHPNSVHLLVVLVDWKTSTGETRMGQCTRYLSTLKVGSKLAVSIKPSVMKLPPSPTQPIIMAGLGTGMAPFRAFIEERAYQRAQGIEVGPIILYFGSRHRAMEYLYGEELDAYAADGLLTHLRLAFSRDQKEKVYIQHKIEEDANLLAEYILDREGAFYLCGPTWPVPDVRDALVKAFKGRGISEALGLEMLETLKEEERYVLEVY